MRRKDAEIIMKHSGWLAPLPEAFGNEVLSRCIMQTYQPGDLVFRRNDGVGGIYGLVSGSVTLNAAPPGRVPLLIQTGSVGAWIGESCFLTRQPRGTDLQVRSATRLMYLPLQEMDQLVAMDSAAGQYFTQILIMNTDRFIRVINDLQIVDARARMAAILDRITNSGDEPMIPLTQAEIGEMAGATRRQVNIAMKEFVAKGWIATNYRMIEVLDPESIRRFYKQAM